MTTKPLTLAEIKLVIKIEHNTGMTTTKSRLARALLASQKAMHEAEEWLAIVDVFRAGAPVKTNAAAALCFAEFATRWKAAMLPDQ